MIVLRDKKGESAFYKNGRERRRDGLSGISIVPYSKGRLLIRVQVEQSLWPHGMSVLRYFSLDWLMIFPVRVILGLFTRILSIYYFANYC